MPQAMNSGSFSKCILCQREPDVALSLDGLEGRELPVCTDHAQFVLDMHMSLMDAFPGEQRERPIIAFLTADKGREVESPQLQQ